MAGLNDGFLLPDDSMEPKAEPAVVVQAFKDDNVDAGEVPELRDDVDLIAVAVEDLQVKLRDLDLLQESITSHGGMSQTIALEAQTLLPEFISEDRPIGFFTKHPSRTMLQVALEEVADQKKGLLEKIKQFIIDMYKRVAEWFKQVFGKADQQINTEENKAVLANAEKMIASTTAMLSSAEKADEAIAAAKYRAAEAKKKADEAAAKAVEDAQATAVAKERAEKITKLMAFIETIKGDEVTNAAVLGELNAMLGRLPNMQRLFSEPTAIDPLLSAHTKALASVLVLLADVKRGVTTKNFDFIEKTLDGDRFAEVAKFSDSHAQATIAFKQLTADFKVENVDEFVNFAKSAPFRSVLNGSELFVQDMKDHEHFMENMDELVKSLYQLTLYTPDQAQEAQGKAALEGLKNFHKQVILPTSQRLAFTYSVVGQLIAFLRGIEGLKETLGTKVAAALKERVMVKAEEVGLDKSDALAFMG